jgi:hypothetical protein
MKNKTTAAHTIAKAAVLYTQLHSRAIIKKHKNQSYAIQKIHIKASQLR